MSKKFFEGMNSMQTMVFGILVSWSAITTLGLVIIVWQLFGGGKIGGSLAYNDYQPTNQGDGAKAAPSAPNAGSLKPASVDDHIRGGKNAKVTLIEFSDFECPFCGHHEPTMSKILATYGDQVRLVYRHFPLNIHPHAEAAAEASECASEQGKFWQYHDLLFKNQQALDTENLKRYAGQLGLNQDMFNNCLDSGKFRGKVAEQTREGESVGVNGTPATFVNGQMIKGAVPYENFVQVIASKLK